MSDTESQDRAQRASSLLDRVRLERENERLKESVKQLDRLVEQGIALVSVLSLDGVLIRIVEAAVSVTGSEEGVLMLLDEPTNELYVKTQKGLGDEHVQTLRLRVNDSLAGQVLKTGRPLRLNEESKVVTGYRVKAVLYVPIAHKDEMLGVILVDNRQTEQAFMKEDESSLTVLSQYAAIAIKNASLVEDLKERNRLLRGLNLTSRSALSSLSLDRVLNQIAESALEVLEADTIILYEYDTAEDNIIVPPVVQGRELDPETLRDVGKVVPHKQSLVFKMIARRRSFYAPRAAQDWTKEGLIDPHGDHREGAFVTREGIASSAGVVLATPSETLGVVFINYATPRAFNEEDKEIIEMFADQAAIAIQNARLFSLEQEQLKLLGSLVMKSPLV